MARRRLHSAEQILSSAQTQEAAARALAAALTSADSAWAWDAVYAAASTTVPRSAFDASATALRALLPAEVDKKRLATTTPALRDLAMWAGGVERGQRLFAPKVLEEAAAPAGSAIAAHVFATLWPWTEDDGCTVRVGLWHPDAGINDRAALGALVQRWFGVSA